MANACRGISARSRGRGEQFGQPRMKQRALVRCPSDPVACANPEHFTPAENEPDDVKRAGHDVTSASAGVTHSVVTYRRP